MTIDEFIATHGITMKATRTDRNPHMDDATMRHWLCTLRQTGTRRSMRVYFSQGTGIAEDPTTADVLGCIANDASGADVSFEEWAPEYGYDEDSRTALRIYTAVVRQTARLENFLGDAYESLMTDVEDF